MTILNKDAILAAHDIQSEDISVPEWGGDVRIAVMSGRARDAFMATQDGKPTPYSLFQGRLLSATIIGEDGALVFTSDDIEALRDKNQEVLDRLVAVAIRINGLAVKAIEDAEKNLDAAPSGDSGSGSPSPSENQ